MLKYVFIENRPRYFKNSQNADPVVLGKAIDKLKTMMGGDGKPFDAKKAEPIVAKTKDKTISPLRNHLEYDDKICGVKWRVYCLRQIANSIQIFDPKKPAEPPRPAFIHLPASPGYPAGTYTPRDLLMNEGLRLAAMRQALYELNSFERRFANLAELCSEIRAVRERLVERIREMAAAMEKAAA